MVSVTWTNLHLQNTTLGYGFHFKQRNLGRLPIETFVHDGVHTLVRIECGYPKASPNTKRHPPPELSI
jgi:hypothetical protein